MIELKNLTKSFDGVEAVRNVSVTVREGAVFGLIGTNGAGKSTLMNILYGLHRPTDGSIYVKGEKIEKFKPMEAIEKGLSLIHI